MAVLNKDRVRLVWENYLVWKYYMVWKYYVICRSAGILYSVTDVYFYITSTGFMMICAGLKIDKKCAVGQSGS